jgi:hypothetical protein
MISDGVESAVKAIPYPNDNVTNSEYSELLRAYDDAKKKILTEFRQRLADEYASDLPELVQDKIWEKSWNAPGRSYFHVEIAYISNTDFAKVARYTK